MTTTTMLASASLLLAANAAAANHHPRQLKAEDDRQAPSTAFPTFSPTISPTGPPGGPTASPLASASPAPSTSPSAPPTVPPGSPTTASPVAAGPAPSNDQCDTGVTLASLPYQATGSTVGATPDFDMASCGATADANGVWYAYTPTDTKLISVSVDGGQSVRVYSGECDEVECLAGLEPTRDFVGEADVDYRFLVSTQDASAGAEFTIEVEDYVVPRNDECETGLVIQTLPFFFSGTTLGALPDFDENSCGAFLYANGVWFSYTPTADVTLTASVTGDQQLRVYTGRCDDLECEEEIAAAQTFPAEANTLYRFLVSSETFAAGANFAISVQEGDTPFPTQGGTAAPSAVPSETPSDAPSTMPSTGSPTPKPSPGPTPPPTTSQPTGTAECDVRNPRACTSEQVCCTAPGASPGDPDSFEQVCTAGSFPNAALQSCGLGPIEDVVCTDFLEPADSRCTPGAGEVCCKVSSTEFGCRALDTCLGLSSEPTPKPIPGPTPPPTPNPTREPITPSPTKFPTPRPTREPLIGDLTFDPTESPVRGGTEVSPTRSPVFRPPAMPVTPAPTFYDGPTDECYSKASKLFKAAKYGHHGSQSMKNGGWSGSSSAKSHKSAKCKSVKGKASKHSSKSGKSIMGKDHKRDPNDIRERSYIYSQYGGEFWRVRTDEGTGGGSSVVRAMGAVAAVGLLVFVGAKFGAVEYRRRHGDRDNSDDVAGEAHDRDGEAAARGDADRAGPADSWVENESG